MNEPTPDPEFSPEWLRVLERARELAAGFKHAHITPEHLLLALLESGDPGVEAVLKSATATPEQMHELVLHHVRAGNDVVPVARLGFSERGKRVIEAARAEARRLNATTLAPAHIVSGLTLVANTVAGAVLRAVGISTKRN